ncbi:Alpha/Beta hydrolase protein [Lactarius pseudohatsudake]|nr:Alpha/Beta hydrolase protein [Lactarius pseudohatsudake]
MSVEQPFKIPVPKDALALLNCKLELHSTAGRCQHAEWAYGAPLTDIRRLDSRRRDGYDWRTHEREVSALPMLTRTIAVEGFSKLSVHYVHQWSAAKCAISLLPAHGFFPYAWSKGVLEKGFHAKHYAEGHVLTLTTASLYGPKHVKASHTNTPMDDMGYFAEQSTKPQTLGFRSACSHGYTRSSSRGIGQMRTPGPKTKFWVSIYWFSRAGPATCVRIYYELAQVGQVVSFPQTTVPVGLSYFPKDLVQFPRVWLRTQAKIVFESEHEVGGHFAAYEQPEALVGDLREMFGKSGPATAIVPDVIDRTERIRMVHRVNNSRTYTNRIILFLKWLALQSLSLLQKAKFYSRSRSTLLPTRLRVNFTNRASYLVSRVTQSGSCHRVIYQSLSHDRPLRPHIT